MTEPASQPLRTWRPMALWSAGILLALGLAWFVGAVVVPYFQVKALLRSGIWGSAPLGPPDVAAQKLGVYMSISRLVHAESKERAWACLVLSDTGEEGTRILAATLRESDPVVRSAAAESLGRIGPKARAAVPALINSLRDSDAKVRSHAAWTLGAVGPEACVAIPELCEAVRNSDAGTRHQAAYAMSKFGPLARPAIPVLIAALDDQDFWVRYGAAWTLGAIGPEAHSTVPALVARLEDSNSVVKVTAAYALCRIESARTDQTVALLIDALQDPNEDACRWAAELLGYIGPSAHAASKPLSGLLQSSDSITRQTAAEALKKIQGGAADK